MLNDDTSNKIKDIISGTHINWQTDNCTAARNYLCRSFTPSTKVKTNFQSTQLIKKEQETALIKYIGQNDLWIDRPPQANRFLTQGGEAEVYLNADEQQVIKFNDAVYYATWLDFFTSILLHNLLFEETGYQLIGFTKRDDDLQVVL